MSNVPPAVPVPPTPLAAPGVLPPGTRLKPAGGWYVLGAVMIGLSMVVPAVVAGTMMSGFFDIVERGTTWENVAVSTSIPGECEVNVPQAGRYQVLHQYKGTFAGEHFQAEPFLPGLTASLVWADTGEVVELHPMIDFVADDAKPRNERTNKLEMWWFEVPRAGDLTLTIACDPGSDLSDRAIFVVDEMFEGDVFFGNFSRMFLFMPIVGLFGTLMFFGGVAIIIVVAVKRSRYRARLIEGRAA